MASQEYQAILAEWQARAKDRPRDLDLAWLRPCMANPTEPAPGTATITTVTAGGEAAAPPTTIGGSAAPPARPQPLRRGDGPRTVPPAWGVPGEWVVGRNTDPGRRLLYLHGGGYVSGCAAAYREFTATLANATGCAVLAIDYRLGPEHPCPAAVHDAVAAYIWMRDHGSDGPAPARHTFIAGDSAGGGLTLATLLALRDARQPLPDAAIPISAYIDLAHTGDSVRTNAEADVVMRPEWLPVMARLYLGGGDPHHPLASPLYGELAGLPPLLLQVGDPEIIRDDSVRFAARARAAGVDVTLEVWPEMMHVWHVRKPEFPEARAAVARIAQFVRERE